MEMEIGQGKMGRGKWAGKMGRKNGQGNVRGNWKSSSENGRQRLPWERIELSRPYGHKVLSLACLPIPAPGR